MLFLTLTLKNCNFSDIKEKNSRKWKQPTGTDGKADPVSDEAPRKLRSLSHARNHGADFVHQPLNHTENPQDHSLNSPESGSHRRTTHHHLWLCNKPHSQTARLCAVFLQQKHALGPPCACHKTQPSRCSVIHMPMAPHMLLYTFILFSLQADATGMENNPSMGNTVLFFFFFF